jgi:hypothetical protein
MILSSASICRGVRRPHFYRPSCRLSTKEVSNQS